MKFKQKAGHLAGILALSAVMYIPQASASPLVVPSPAGGDSFSIFNIGTGGFTDNYAFAVNSDALFSFTGGSIDTLGTGVFNVLTQGASLSSVSLLDTTTNISQPAFLSSSSEPTITITNPNGTYDQTTYSASLGGVALNTTDSYELVFKGTSEIANSKVTGTIFLAPAPVVTAVPLPSATWLFLSGLMGFLGLNKSRKANKAA